MKKRGRKISMSDDRSDDRLGLSDPTITRRDFVGGTMLGAGVC
jgi:hypothetical protein